MASGYGIRGGTTRCYAFWQEVMACYIVNTTGDDNRGAEKCWPQLDDYLECLHHKKEAERVGKLTAAYRKWESEHPEMKRKTAGEIRSLGVIEATMEEKNLKVSKWIPHRKYN